MGDVYRGAATLVRRLLEVLPARSARRSSWSICKASAAGSSQTASPDLRELIALTASGGVSR